MRRTTIVGASAIRPRRSDSWPTSMLPPWSQVRRVLIRSLARHARRHVVACPDPEPTCRSNRVPVDDRTGRTTHAPSIQPGGRPVHSRTRAPSRPPTATLVETTTYRLTIPWFGWLFALAGRAAVARSHGDRRTAVVGAARPARRRRQILVLGLARRCVDDRGVRQHAVHADRQLRRRRLRRRRHGDRRRRCDRARRHRPGASRRRCSPTASDVDA